jgi:hypothetical protein
MQLSFVNTKCLSFDCAISVVSAAILREPAMLTSGYIPRTRCHIPPIFVVPEDGSSLADLPVHPDSITLIILSRKIADTRKQNYANVLQTEFNAIN